MASVGRSAILAIAALLDHPLRSAQDLPLGVADLPVMAATGLQHLFEREQVLIAEVALQCRTPTPLAGASGAKAPCP